MKRIIITLAAITIIVALWTGAWLFVAGQISQTVASAATPPDPKSASLACADFSVTGFPFRFDATCTNATIIEGDITLTVGKIKAMVLVYRPTHLLAFIDGPAHFSDAFYGTEQEMRWDLLQTSLRTNGWQLARFSLHGENIAYYDTLIGDTLLAQSPEIELHLLDIKEQHDPEQGLAALALYTSAKATDLPIFGISKGALRAEAELTGVPDDVRRLSNPDLLRFWQAAGGKLTLTSLTANDAISTIDMTGEVSLSPAGELMGKLDGTSNQVAERFANFFQPEYQQLIFGTPQIDGTYKQTISIVRGAVFTGIIPLGVLPPLF